MTQPSQPASSGLFVVVLVGPNNKLEVLLPRIPSALAAIMHARTGEVVRVDNEQSSHPRDGG